MDGFTFTTIFGEKINPMKEITTNTGSLVLKEIGKPTETLNKGLQATSTAGNQVIVTGNGKRWVLPVADTTLDGAPYDNADELAEAISVFARSSGGGVTQEEFEARNAEFDERIDEVAAINGAAPYPITGLALPQTPDVTDLPDRASAVIYGDTAGRTYTQTGADDITVSANKGRSITYNKATNLWIAGQEFDLPQVAVANESGQSTTVASSQKLTTDVKNLVSNRYNLWRDTENLSSNSYSTTSATKNPQTIEFNKVQLQRLNSTTYFSALFSNLRGIGADILEDGKSYLFSFYTKLGLNGGINEELIFWPRNLPVSAQAPYNNYLFGGRILDGNIRRHWFMVRAVGTDRILRLVNPNDQSSPLNTDTNPYWFTAGRSIVSSNTSNNDIYVGGFQIEEVSNPQLDGIAWMGDSTMAGAAGKVDNGNSREVSRWLEGLLNCTSFNRAVGGQRTDQMDARWSEDITPLKWLCKYVVIQGGINDLAQGRALSEIQGSIQSMYNKAISDGFIPVVLTCTPASNIVSATNGETNRLALNTWIKQNFINSLDIASVVCDPTDPSKLAPYPQWQGDEIHYGIRARKAVANYMSQWTVWDFSKPKDYQRITGNSFEDRAIYDKIGSIPRIIPLSI